MFSIWAIVALIPLVYVLWNVYIRTSTFHVLLRQIPGPTYYPVVGNALEVLGGFDHVQNKIQVEWPKTYGEIYHFLLGSDVYVAISSPELSEAIYSSQKIINKGREYDTAVPWLGQGLLLSSGDKWRSRRKLLTPAFHFKILDNFMESFNRQSSILCRILSDRCATKPKQMEVYRLITRASLDVICDAAMGTHIHAQTEDSGYIRAVYRMTQVLLERMQRPWLVNDVLWSLSSLGREQTRLVKVLHDFTNKVINQRREKLSSDKPRTDDDSGIRTKNALLDLLLVASDGGKVLSHEDIREEIDTFMFEGHDTTSAGLSWFLYCMADNPSHQERVIEELRDIFAHDPDRDCTQEDMAEMKYLERCIKEALRLYPPVPFIERVSQDYVKIGDYTIPPGCNISLLIMATHMNPRVFPEPEKFDPDRFLPEQSAGRHPYAYVPFSAGPRNCIGQRFAMMELKVMTSALLRRFRFSLAPGSKKPIPSWQVILKPLDGLNLIVTPQ